ncbi:NUMOD3 domain-containing DNA-binding protein, partial [bacterium]|nr:NUMOD3 domain-containing DNA-binding protein [bacterium]
MYYIYVYLNPLKKTNFIFGDLFFEYEPFYIGRGKNKRYHAHMNNSLLKKKSEKNDIINEIINNDKKPIIEFLLTGLTYSESDKMEIYYISKIGRIKDGGTLTNLTTGGQGNNGYIMSDESKQKMINSNIKNGLYIRLSEKMKGKNNIMFGDKWHRTEDGKKNFSEKMLGRNVMSSKNDDEMNEIYTKISNSLKNYNWCDEEKEKRRNGMKKVWENIKNNNEKRIKEVILLNILTGEEILFTSKNKASK